MSQNTAIEWCDHTFNPWEGCQKVGPGCDHCYAETRNARFGGGVAPNWGPGAPRRRTSASNWAQPLRWDREAVREGRRYRVFCASLADVFDNAVDPAWRADLFALIRATPNLDWLLLTKRAGNVFRMLPPDWGGGYPNVWLGATFVDQAEAERDIGKFLNLPARVRFLSIEPLLGPIDLTCLRDRFGWRDALRGERHASSEGSYDVIPWLNRIDWLIVGGESGRGARPMHPSWARSLRDQCAAADVPFLFKQWGEWANAWVAKVHPNVCYEHGTAGGWLEPDGTLSLGERAAPISLNAMHVFHIGKKRAGRLLDGVQHDGYPA